MGFKKDPYLQKWKRFVGTLKASVGIERDSVIFLTFSQKNGQKEYLRSFKDLKRIAKQVALEKKEDDRRSSKSLLVKLQIEVIAKNLTDAASRMNGSMKEWLQIMDENHHRHQVPRPRPYDLKPISVHTVHVKQAMPKDVIPRSSSSPPPASLKERIARLNRNSKGPIPVDAAGGGARPRPANNAGSRIEEDEDASKEEENGDDEKKENDDSFGTDLLAMEKKDVPPAHGSVPPSPAFLSAIGKASQEDIHEPSPAERSNEMDENDDDGGGDEVPPPIRSTEDLLNQLSDQVNKIFTTLMGTQAMTNEQIVQSLYSLLTQSSLSDLSDHLKWKSILTAMVEFGCPRSSFIRRMASILNQFVNIQDSVHMDTHSANVRSRKGILIHYLQKIFTEQLKLSEDEQNGKEREQDESNISDNLAIVPNTVHMRRLLGIIKLTCCLFNESLLGKDIILKGIIDRCIKTAENDFSWDCHPNDTQIEIVCIAMEICGEKMDSITKAILEERIERLETLVQEKEFSERSRQLVVQLVHRRKFGWRNDSAESIDKLDDPLDDDHNDDENQRRDEENDPDSESEADQLDDKMNASVPIHPSQLPPRLSPEPVPPSQKKDRVMSTIYIRNMPQELDKVAIRSFFSSCGEIEQLFYNKSRNMYAITFANENETAPIDALEMVTDTKISIDIVDTITHSAKIKSNRENRSGLPRPSPASSSTSATGSVSISSGSFVDIKRSAHKMVAPDVSQKGAMMDAGKVGQDEDNDDNEESNDDEDRNESASHRVNANPIKDSVDDLSESPHDPPPRPVSHKESSSDKAIPKSIPVSSQKRKLHFPLRGYQMVNDGKDKGLSFEEQRWEHYQIYMADLGIISRKKKVERVVIRHEEKGNQVHPNELGESGDDEEEDDDEEENETEHEDDENGRDDDEKRSSEIPHKTSGDTIQSKSSLMESDPRILAEVADLKSMMSSFASMFANKAKEEIIARQDGGASKKTDSDDESESDNDSSSSSSSSSVPSQSHLGQKKGQDDPLSVTNDGEDFCDDISAGEKLSQINDNGPPAASKKKSKKKKGKKSGKKKSKKQEKTNESIDKLVACVDKLTNAVNTFNMASSRLQESVMMHSSQMQFSNMYMSQIQQGQNALQASILGRTESPSEVGPSTAAKNGPPGSTHGTPMSHPLPQPPPPPPAHHTPIMMTASYNPYLTPMTARPNIPPPQLGGIWPGNVLPQSHPHHPLHSHLHPAHSPGQSLSSARIVPPPPVPVPRYPYQPSNQFYQNINGTAPESPIIRSIPARGGTTGQVMLDGTQKYPSLQTLSQLSTLQRGEKSVPVQGGGGGGASIEKTFSEEEDEDGMVIFSSDGNGNGAGNNSMDRKEDGMSHAYSSGGKRSFVSTETERKLAHLASLGHTNRTFNLVLLNQHKGDLEAVLRDLKEF